MHKNRAGTRTRDQARLGPLKEVLRKPLVRSFKLAQVHSTFVPFSTKVLQSSTELYELFSGTQKPIENLLATCNVQIIQLCMHYTNNNPQLGSLIISKFSGAIVNMEKNTKAGKDRADTPCMVC